MNQAREVLPLFNDASDLTVKYAEGKERNIQPQQAPSLEQINLLQDLLKAVINDSPGIYKLLENNLSLLDDTFVYLLQALGNQLQQANTLEGNSLLGELLYRLAYIFYGFPRGNPLINLAIAVYGYEFCAATKRQLGLEKDLALTLNNLGNAYLAQAELGKEPIANLDKAIAAYAEATTTCRQLGLQRDLAGTLNNRGVAYLAQARLEKEPQTNLEKAMTAFQKAAMISKELDLKIDLAQTFNNLGAAYFTQAQLGRETQSNLEKAIATYTEANTILLQLGLEKDLASNFNNLGNVYLFQAELGKDPQNNLEKALTAYRKGLEIHPRELLNIDWTRMQINLGNAYQLKGNLDEAINCYRKSLEFLTKSSFPQYWGDVQSKYGQAFYNRYLKSENTEDINQAVKAYENALSVLNLSNNYKTFGMVLNKLGKALFAQRNYSRAIQILEQTYELWEKKKQLPELAVTLCELAKLYHRTGCLERARLYFKDSLRLFRRRQKSDKILPVLIALGNLELQCGKIDQGIEHLKEAQAYLQDHPNSEKLTEVEYLLSLVPPTHTQNIQYVNP
jgi:tetratricopeptide (TPR) repeat protein